MQVSAVDYLRAEPDPTSERKVFDRDEFLRILLAQLENQNPLEPLENNEFFGQLAQLQMLDATEKLSDAIGDLVAGERLGRASSLLGRTVRGVAEDGSPVEGRVDRLLMGGGTIRLEVGGVSLPMELVREVEAPAA